MKSFVSVFVLSGVLLIAAAPASLKPSKSGPQKSTEELPALLHVRDQQAVRKSWLKKRLDTMLLPMMRQQKIDMWIVVNEEFHPDPVTEYIAPPLPYVGRRDFFIFADRGGDKLERLALVRYSEEHLKYFFDVLNPPARETPMTLRRLVEERKPKTIALNMGGTRGATNGLSLAPALPESLLLRLCPKVSRAGSARKSLAPALPESLSLRLCPKVSCAGSARKSLAPALPDSLLRRLCPKVSRSGSAPKSLAPALPQSLSLRLCRRM